MEKTIRGSLGAASAFQMTEDMDALDKQSKKILKYFSSTSERISEGAFQIHKF